MKRSNRPPRYNKRSKKECGYCKAFNKTPYVGHDVKSCWIIPKEDKADLIKAFSVMTVDSDDSDGDELDTDDHVGSSM